MGIILMGLTFVKDTSKDDGMSRYAAIIPKSLQFGDAEMFNMFIKEKRLEHFQYLNDKKINLRTKDVLYKNFVLVRKGNGYVLYNEFISASGSEQERHEDNVRELLKEYNDYINNV